MKKKHKDKLKEKLEEKFGRPAKEDEISHLKTDALHLAQYLLEQVEELEDRIEKLEKNKK